ncbi:MAG: hypothetical protein R3310_13900 [Candidatus Competibacteraceae bacterium]|nr:hypothetical protein [Candidatus Competibacteraceae bacterium]
MTSSSKPPVEQPPPGRHTESDRPLTRQYLDEQNAVYQGTGGVSQSNAIHRFRPAFLDTDTGEVRRACYRNGQPAALHVLDGLPDHWVLKRSEDGHVLSAKPSVIAGFEHQGRFYTRDEAAACLYGPIPPG